MIWFTSDWHFFHDRILEFHPKRKEIFGTDIKEVTEKMIQKWNSRVNKHDTVYILGDLSFGTVEQKRKLFQRLNGNKILILGNHDKIPTELQCYFNSISTIKNVKFKKANIPELNKDIEIIMCHFPLYRWKHYEKGSIHLHGHCHGSIDSENVNLINDTRFNSNKIIRIDVGLDSIISNYDMIPITKLNKYI